MSDLKDSGGKQITDFFIREGYSIVFPNLNKRELTRAYKLIIVQLCNTSTTMYDKIQNLKDLESRIEINKL